MLIAGPQIFQIQIQIQIVYLAQKTFLQKIQKHSETLVNYYIIWIILNNFPHISEQSG